MVGKSTLAWFVFNDITFTPCVDDSPNQVVIVCGGVTKVNGKNESHDKCEEKIGPN
jgi:hypothetical protein